MILRRFRLEAHGDVRIDCYPADVDVNPAYRAAVETYLGPYTLAAHLGRLSDETAEVALAEVYADAVIYGSPDPDLQGMDREGWVSWLLEDRDRFAALRGAAEDPDHFAEEGVG